MDNNDLIDKLAKEGSNTRKKFNPVSSFCKWIVITLVSVIGGSLSLGIRGDWLKIFREPSLLLQNFVLLFGFIVTGYAAFKLSTPGQMKRKKVIALLVTLFLFWGVAILSMYSGDGVGGAPSFSFGCIRDILIIGGIPGAALLMFLFHGVILERVITGLVASVALLCVGAWAVQFTCHNDHPFHIFVSHFLPMIVCSAAGAGIFLKFHKKL